MALYLNTLYISIAYSIQLYTVLAACFIESDRAGLYILILSFPLLDNYWIVISTPRVMMVDQKINACNSSID